MGHYLSSPNKEKITEEGQFGNMKYAASGMQGWRVSMEDAHIAKFNIAPDTHVFGVFDGHGGHEVAKFVTNHFIDELLINSSFQTGNYSKALVETFFKMDELLRTADGKKEIALIKSSSKKGGFGAGDGDSNAGCTANVALMVKNKLYVANAGDSRTMITTKGEPIFLSEDHKPDNQIEKDRIHKAGGEVYEGRINGRLNLSRALGDFDYKDSHQLSAIEQLVIALPDVKVWDMTPDDEFLLLGCDGIWECLPANEISNFITNHIKNGKDLKYVIEETLDHLIATDTSTGLGLDNMTSIIVTLK